MPLATQVKLTAEPVLTVTDAGDLVMEDITMTVTLDAWCSVPGQGKRIRDADVIGFMAVLDWGAQIKVFLYCSTLSNITETLTSVSV